MNDDFPSLATRLKNHLDENDGELVYWGEELVITSEAKPSNEATKAQRLQSLFTDTIGDCRLCPLGDTRIKLVFGVGNPDARVMFVGEGPGFDEDRKGEPFVGKAGQLLDKIMAAIGLSRANAYIANVVKCHPMVNAATPDKRGNDRAPAPEEMEKCLPFLKMQIDIIRPAFIVTLGATATKALLGRREGITALRGRIIHAPLVEGAAPIPVLPTFHPAALLRDETLKKPVWEDMKMLRGLLNSEAPL